MSYQTRLSLCLVLLLAVVVPACRLNNGADSKLVGTWKAKVVELGIPTEIIWHIKPDGTTGYVFTTPLETTTMEGTWTYSDGTIYETVSGGASASSSIRWVDQDNFILTIKDNGVPAYRGLKRSYRRL